MEPTRDAVMTALRAVRLPDGRDLVAADVVRALGVQDGAVRFVLEGAGPQEQAVLEGLRGAAEAAVRALPGVRSVSAMALAAGGPKIGGHPKAQPAGPQPVPGVRKVIVVGSGKGGVGKSTVASNLAVALARTGLKVGLLDADIYGPSQHRMMGVSRRPASPDGTTILPIEAHGVSMMSIGLLTKPDEAIIWRGPMLMGAMQQLLGQVAWDTGGARDVLVIDLPPGTGDVQLTLCQKTRLDGAIVVSTPQDVALIDARRALDMFRRLGTPVLGLIENMSSYICTNCGHEAHPFGHGGVAQAAAELGLPLLGTLPLALEVRTGGDSGQPVAAGSGPAAERYADLARALRESGAL